MNRTDIKKITNSNSHKKHDNNLEQTKILQELNYYKNLEPTNKVLLSSSSGIAVYADSSPTPTADNDNRDGWLHKKIATGTDKFNYYFFSEGNNPMYVSDLLGLCANVSIDKWDNNSSAPFFNVYTKMTGSGDAGSWYKSRISYSIDNTVDICVGEHIEVWAKNQPNSYSGLRQVELKTKVVNGTGADDEEIYTICLSSDSASLIDTQILVSSLGFDTIKNINHRVKLIS